MESEKKGLIGTNITGDEILKDTETPDIIIIREKHEGIPRQSRDIIRKHNFYIMDVLYYLTSPIRRFFSWFKEKLRN